ncbi:MAG: S8 family serine peptidase [Planctomycetes bacterium]|nr:S8 family serine peptidase [Planctomycetota bacterium]
MRAGRAHLVGVPFIALAVAAACWPGRPAAPGASVAAPAIARPAPAARERLVVAGVDLPRVAADHGLGWSRALPALEAAVLEADDAARALAALRDDPRVRHASPDVPFEVTGDACCERPSIELDDASYARARAEVAATFGALRAGGARDVLVAVLDTGVDGAHPDLREALAGGRSFLADDPAWDEDTAGHGTAMASLVAAVPADPLRGVEGVAPGARVLPLKVADRRGLARLGDVAAALVYAVDRGASIVLLSLGTRQAAPLLDDALAYAEARGVLVVAAAGNRNVHVDLEPAADPRVLSVGCVDGQGDLALGTALAPTTDLLAPGVAVVAALPRRAHAPVTGSSVSAARVAGAAALVRAAAPDLDPARLRALLRAARAPLPLFADHPDVARAFRAGPLDAAALARALRERAPDLALADPRVLPGAAAPGEPVLASVRVTNRGLRASGAFEVGVSIAGREVARVGLDALGPGEETVLRAKVLAPGPGEVRFALADRAVACALDAADRPVRGLAIARATARPAAGGALDLEVEVEGRGAVAAGGAVAVRLGAFEALAPFAPLGAGETARVALSVPPAAVAALPDQVATARVRLVGARGEDGDEVALDLEPPHLSPLRTQYQQGGAVNVIADAPWRLNPARPYLPLLVFAAEKGDLDPTTWLRLERTRIFERSAAGPSGAGQLVYEDRAGAATTAPAGLVIADEMGQPLLQGGAPDVRLFGHVDLGLPGRYAILRLPRAALGVAPVPAAPEVRFLEVDIEWARRRSFLGITSVTQQGRTRKTLRVLFARSPRPQLQGDNGYYDAHVHTIAEWTHTDAFDLLAPRKNLGGPIPMVLEASLALGLTDALDGRGRLITTDHNTFYYARGPQDDTIHNRPPFGPTSPAASGGRSEWERMGDLFGLTRGEEICVHSDGMPGNFFGVQLPLGSHLLKYRAEHIDGPWHGGSSVARGLGDPSPDVELDRVLDRLATQNRQENAQAALYAAHPFSGDLGWTDWHYDTAFERDPARRVDLGVHVEQTGFVMKGLQLWNGDGGRRSLDSSKIDWADVNPWTDPDFVRGYRNWDGGLYRGLASWHQDLSGLLTYELSGRPGVRFPRKVFIAGGNDAHGDFNITESRFATVIDLQSTYKVNARAYGRVLTYAMADGQPGATPAERAFGAFIDGQSVLTDGPLVTFSLDAEDRFDATRLAWADLAPAALDRDGRIGGGGAFDGAGTALVRRGSPNVRLRYRYASTEEFGPVTHLPIWRTSEGDPNPLGSKPGGGALLAPRGALAAAGADQDLEEALDPAEEGLITAPTVLQVGAFTGDPGTMGADGARCITNPVWCVPYDADVTIARTETDAAGRGFIPPGALRVRLAFDMSLTPAPLALEVKALDQGGASSDASAGPIDVLAPVAGSGWSDQGGVKDCVHEVTNTRPLPLDLDRYPAPDRVTFVVYSYEAPRDPFDNALNRVAFTFDAPGIGTGGGTGPQVQRGASTAAPLRAGGRSGGGGGCALAGPASRADGAAPLLVALLLIVAARRRR